MGRRGPRPKPAEIRAYEGNAGNRPEQPGMAPPAAEPPDPPAWLIGDALTAWQQLAPQLLEQGCLEPLDAEPLARYCVELVIWRMANDEAQKGLFETTPNGMQVMAPAISILHAADKILTRTEALFGMNPTARLTIKVAAPERDELDEYTRDAVG